MRRSAEAIEKTISESLRGTPRERAEASVKRGKEIQKLDISPKEYDAYKVFLEYAPFDTELRVPEETGQIVTKTLREIVGEDEIDIYGTMKMLHSLKTAGPESNAAWRDNWSTIARIAHVFEGQV